jgi:hypothetical protein
MQIPQMKLMSKGKKNRWLTRQPAVYTLSLSEYEAQFGIGRKHQRVITTYKGIMSQAIREGRKVSPKVLVSLIDLGCTKQVKRYLIKQTEI